MILGIKGDLVMQWVIDRAKERSTWIGISALLGFAGIHVADGTMQLIADLVVAGSGLAAVAMKE